MYDTCLRPRFYRPLSCVFWLTVMDAFSLGQVVAKGDGLKQQRPQIPMWQSSFDSWSKLRKTTEVFTRYHYWSVFFLERSKNTSTAVTQANSHLSNNTQKSWILSSFLCIDEWEWQMQHKSWKLQTGIYLGVCQLSVEAELLLSCFSFGGGMHFGFLFVLHVIF